MQNSSKLKIVIAGGGTAGWMAACAFARQLNHCTDVTLVESDDIGTVGVGEATIPTMRTFHLLLNLDEAEVMRQAHATFKLGIQFENWGQQGEKYFHSFGTTGKDCWAGEFQHFWMRGLREGVTFPFGDYSLDLQAALAEKFALMDKPRLNHAYHLDAGLYAKYLRKLSEEQGVRRVEGTIAQVKQDPDSGNITSLVLHSGEEVSGDIFIDCTGFRGLLIEQTLHSGYEDWSHYFLCDRAVAMQTELQGPILPYTRAIAHASGWQWRIPLQHRQGNGFVYSSSAISDDEATELLRNNVVGKPINEPRIIPFRPGRRRQLWNKNCVAIGLASGFIEPLESTSIHLISSSIIRFMKMLPLGPVRQTDIDEYNRQGIAELNAIRDFIVLHYKATQRNDSEFWRYCKSMSIPESLATRMDIYRDSARLYWEQGELFTVNSWNQVLLGQGVMPKSYHPVADLMGKEELVNFLNGYRSSMLEFVKQMPAHADFVKGYCAAQDKLML